MAIPGRPWESVSVDLITDLPHTVWGHDTVVVFVDRLSKMVHLAATDKKVTGERMAELFQDHVWKHHGIPQSIVSDRDVRFQSQLWRELNRKFGCRLDMSSAMHPQTDGQTERTNRVLEDTLRHFVGPYQTDWDTLLSVAEFAMNNAWNESFQNTPFMLNYGQHPDTPAVARLRSRNPAVNKFVGRWSEQLQKAKQCLQAAQQRQKTHADKQRRPAPQLRVGDQVLLNIKHVRLRSGIKSKLAPRFLGPFKVLGQVGTHGLSFRIELPPALARMHNVFHVSSLKKYHAGPYQPPPLPDLVDGEIEFEVDWIEATRYEGKRRQYLVHWVGYPGGETWEKESQLTHCPDKVRQFWEFKGMDCPHALRGE